MAARLRPGQKVNSVIALQQAVTGQALGIADTAKQPDVQRDIAALQGGGNGR